MQHLAIIPDGNRRWAKKNKLKSILGHKKGLDAFDIAVKFCLKNNIKYLSIYIFSLENFNRSEEEKKYLFDLLIELVVENVSKFIKQRVRVRFLGNKDYFPQKVKPAIERMEKETAYLDKLNLNFLFCYGAKNEIVNAVKQLATKVKNGILDVEDIDEESISKSLWTTGIPDPDLIIRTSNRFRLSNFLLYQAAYSEIKVIDCYWPEITENHLEECCKDFKNIQRNFGK
ncbi:di-trans,poly-cis-decaprenylcistransferase [Candidatus Babeliales bacterium]|nr:di-trans,poly-cis-decaprenylcistransferase [Candidatus Babeliales bacterium]